VRYDLCEHVLDNSKNAFVRQLTDEQIINCGITPDQVRMSVGIEDADDIIADIKKALGE